MNIVGILIFMMENWIHFSGSDPLFLQCASPSFTLYFHLIVQLFWHTLEASFNRKHMKLCISMLVFGTENRMIYSFFQWSHEIVEQKALKCAFAPKRLKNDTPDGIMHRNSSSVILAEKWITSFNVFSFRLPDFTSAREVLLSKLVDEMCQIQFLLALVDLAVWISL